MRVSSPGRGDPRPSPRRNRISGISRAVAFAGYQPARPWLLLEGGQEHDCAFCPCRCSSLRSEIPSESTHMRARKPGPVYIYRHSGRVLLLERVVPLSGNSRRGGTGSGPCHPVITISTMIRQEVARRAVGLKSPRSESVQAARRVASWRPCSAAFLSARLLSSLAISVNWSIAGLTPTRVNSRLTTSRSSCQTSSRMRRIHAVA